MNKRILKFLTLCLISSSSLLTGDLKDDFINCDKTLKLLAAGFFPTHDRVREIYGSILSSYQVESTFGINEWSLAWVNLDYTGKHGHSDHLKYSTHLKMGSLSLGASMIGQVRDDLKIYLGCGYSISYLHLHNHRTRKHQHQSKGISGLQIKSGILYDINCGYFAEFFGDYLYQPNTFKTHVSLSGFKVGGGLGYKF